MDIVLHTQQEEAKDRALGGKASGLLHLEAQGAQVPPFLVVAPEVFYRHLPKAEWDAFLAEQATVDPEKPQQTYPAAEKLCEAIMDGALDDAVTGALEAGLGKIPSKHYAIRSSMLGEDSAEHSFAGQLESFLFQESVDDVKKSIKRCWCSALQPRVLAYRSRAGLKPEDIRVAVVVQRMINSEVSGVLFTVHPQTGHRSRLLVSAAWGQGEGIVSGSCNTDEFVWDKSKGELEHTVADKDTIFIADPKAHSGTREESTPEDKRHIRCLTEAQLDTLGKRAAHLEEAFGYPLDIEWALEGGEFYFVQARPITALPEAPNEDGPLVVWDNSNIQESYCGVTTPMTFTYAQRGYLSAYQQTMEAMGIPQEEIEAATPWLRNLLGIIRGRVYYNINNWYKGLTVLPSFGQNKEDMEEMMGLKDPVDFVEDMNLTFWEKVQKLPRLLKTLYRMLKGFRDLKHTVPIFQDNFEQHASKLSIDKIKDMSFSQLMQLNEDLRVNVQEKWHTPIVNDFYVMMSTGALRRFLAKQGLDNPIQLQNHLLAGEPGIESTEPTKVLVGLADTLRADPEFMKQIENQTDGEIFDALLAHSPETKKIIDHYIYRYGDRVMGELKLETETLREDPAFLIQILKNYLYNDKLTLKKLEEQEQKLRRTAEEKVFNHISGFSKGKAQKLMKRMRDAVKNRENMRLTRTRAFGLSRAIYRALGQRLVDAGKLDDLNDIFYLTVDELEMYHEGRSICTDLRGLTKVRRAEFESYEEKDLPHHFSTVGAVYHGNRYVYSGKIEIDPDAPILHGLGCYPGKVKAPIQLIFKPEEAKDLDGKILCTVRTDPGWAPLFPSVSGILVERGSTLSHSAVVARELGIPAVVNIPGLTELLDDKEEVTMDGDLGTVERSNV